MFEIVGNRHPPIVKEHLAKSVSLETLVLLNKIIGFKPNFDKKLDDPVWKFLSMRMDKYDSFIHIDVFKYKKILKEVVIHGKALKHLKICSSKKQNWSSNWKQVAILI